MSGAMQVPSAGMHLVCGMLSAGVLRNVARMRASNSVPSPSEEAGGSAADALATAASHPTWMVERWLQRYGRDGTMQLLAANNRCAAQPAPPLHRARHPGSPAHRDWLSR